MRIGRSIAILVACVTAGHGAFAEQVADEGTVRILREIRIVQDIAKFSAALSDIEERAPFVPIDIHVEGIRLEPGGYWDSDARQFVRDPDRPRGAFCRGWLGIASSGDARERTRRVEYDVRFQDIDPRPNVEEGRVSSPYFSEGGAAICEMTGEMEDGAITVFPPTYLLPAAWLEDGVKTAREYRERKGRRVASMDTPLGAALFALQSQEPWTADSLARTMVSGDRYSIAILVQCLLRSEKVELSQFSAAFDMQTAETREGVALGLVVSSRGGRDERERAKALFLLLERQLMQGEPSRYSKDLAQWLGRLGVK